MKSARKHRSLPRTMAMEDTINEVVVVINVSTTAMTTAIRDNSLSEVVDPDSRNLLSRLMRTDSL